MRSRVKLWQRHELSNVKQAAGQSFGGGTDRRAIEALVIQPSSESSPASVAGQGAKILNLGIRAVRDHPNQHCSPVV